MQVFVTGATGFIGGVVVPELLRAGHRVLGLTRTEAGDRALAAMGAQAHRGDLDDLDSLRRGAAQADGVIHAGFVHDFSNFAQACAIDGRAIDALGDVLAGSTRPLVVTAGVPGLAGRVTTELDDIPAGHPLPRVSEQRALALVARGIHASVIRLPQVHDRDKAGLVAFLIAAARETGISAYVGAGENRWAAAHRFDTAPLYRLALERGKPGARYHAVAEEGVALKDIAEAVGRGLKVPAVSLTPEDAAKHFGARMFFAGISNPASSTLTREWLGWAPGPHPGLVEDLNHSTAYAA